MKHNIITPQQVVEIAFSDGGYLSPDVVAQVDIEAAAERWVKPVVGEATGKKVIYDISASRLVREDSAASSVDYIKKNLENVGAADQVAALDAKAAELGLNIVCETSFTADNKNDLSTQVTKCQEAGCDLVFLPIYYQPASVILSQADAMGYAPTFFGVDGMDGILTLEGFDASLAEGVMLLTPFSADAQDDLTKNFVAKYQEAYGEIPNQFAADAYDAIYIIKAALEKAGATAEMSAEEINEAMKAAMLEITVDGLTGAGMTWTEDGEVNKEPKAVKIVDGVYTAM